MKVKVGGNVYDATKEPVMVILYDKDKENISNMKPGATCYCAFPDGTSPEEVKKFMKLDNDDAKSGS